MEICFKIRHLLPKEFVTINPVCSTDNAECKEIKWSFFVALKTIAWVLKPRPARSR